ncbi:MAG: mycofactocin biosynthesis chaperone MftB [Ilumatobacteraceae bacterium]
MSTEAIDIDRAVDRALEVHPHVAIRDEPFGALAYHYDNRRLVFLRHPDVVRVIRALGEHPTLADTLVACDIDRSRWQSFITAVASLERAEVVRAR